MHSCNNFLTAWEIEDRSEVRLGVDISKEWTELKSSSKSSSALLFSGLPVCAIARAKRCAAAREAAVWRRRDPAAWEEDSLRLWRGWWGDDVAGMERGGEASEDMLLWRLYVFSIGSVEMERSGALIWDDLVRFVSSFSFAFFGSEKEREIERAGSQGRRRVSISYHAEQLLRRPVAPTIFSTSNEKITLP